MLKAPYNLSPEIDNCVGLISNSFSYDVKRTIKYRVSNLFETCSKQLRGSVKPSPCRRSGDRPINPPRFALETEARFPSAKAKIKKKSVAVNSIGVSNSYINILHLKFGGAFGSGAHLVDRNNTTSQNVTEKKHACVSGTLRACHKSNKTLMT